MDYWVDYPSEPSVISRIVGLWMWGL